MDLVTCEDVATFGDSVATEDIRAQGVTVQISVQQSALISTCRSSDVLQHKVEKGRLIVNRNINTSATLRRRFRIFDLKTFTLSFTSRSHSRRL